MPETAPDVSYESTYRQRLDEKRRVPVPHRWRSGTSEDFHLVIWQQHRSGICLRGHTPASMAKLREKINALPDGPDKAAMKRLIGSRSITVTVDNAGRIAIPEEMATAADLKTDAVFVGLLDRFEIWSPNRYAAVESADKEKIEAAMQLLE